MLTTAATWADILDVDSEAAKAWLHIAGLLADYPTTIDVLSKRRVFSQSVDMDSNESICFGSNYDEPLLTLASIFPGGQVARRSHGAPATQEELAWWDTGNATLWALAAFVHQNNEGSSWA